MFRRVITKQIRFINTHSENTIKEFIEKNNPNMNINFELKKYTFSRGCMQLNIYYTTLHNFF